MAGGEGVVRGGESVLLTIDIGNTQTVLGIYRGEELLGCWRISTDPRRSADELGILVGTLFLQRAKLQTGLRAVEGAILSSVVPSLTKTFTTMVQQECEAPCLIVGPGIRTGLPIRYEDPREVGADRIVNAVAAWRRWSRGLIVVDFGTATTFDVVGKKGSYLGGAIFPGIGIASEALFSHAARLPRVELRPPRSAIGRNTVNSIQSGLVFGSVAMVDGLIQRMSKELDFKPFVVATGGLASLVAEHSEMIEEVEPLLTLEGLRLLYEMNRINN